MTFRHKFPYICVDITVMAETLQELIKILHEKQNKKNKIKSKQTMNNQTIDP